MLRSLLRRLRQLSRRIHVRVILFAVLALVALGLATLTAPLIPPGLGSDIGAGAVDTILQILATSMLAVTTFSLTIMLNALSNAASQWTPRSHLILREDTVTHSVLANFLGAYLFALLAIVIRAAGLFDERGIVVLFGMTIFVVAVIVISLIRWIVHLEGLGSLAFTAGMLEREASDALTRSGDRPCHGGHALTDPLTQIPQDALPLHAPKAGYLQQIFEDALQAEAQALGLKIYITVSVGQYLLEGDVMGFVAGTGGRLDGALPTVLQETMPLADVRSFDQDPIFGLTVLAEVATRALSPGVNDPGTAIDVIKRLAKVLSCARAALPETPRNDRLWMPPLEAGALFEASFDPIARCAGDAVEVHLALQSSLAQVAVSSRDAAIRQAAQDTAARSLQRAQAAITFEPDLQRLQASVP